ncbi:hypothetical protein NFI96_023964 [Prochilodus magdalenae]|nr:hypothetical protein NFI96_023964 [Prochilodus magdalenae]
MAVDAGVAYLPNRHSVQQRLSVLEGRRQISVGDLSPQRDRNVAVIQQGPAVVQVSRDPGITGRQQQLEETCTCKTCMEELHTGVNPTHQSSGLVFNITLWRQRAEANRQVSTRTNNSTKMVALTLPPRPTLLLMVLMSMVLVTSAFPQPHYQPLPRNSAPLPQDHSKQEQWEVLYPSISLRDWSIQMLSAPDFGGAKPRAEQLGVNEWSPLSQSQVEEDLVKEWPADWTQRTGTHEKRNIVVADDAAFREKSKLLTAMERQKWLNSYMQKLLVVNSK